MMKMRKNNKGFSLVEMIVAVAILSIVMLGIAWILSAMSKSFSNSQREVQLQDSVQTTYSVVSDLIKESQTADSSQPSVIFDSSKNRAYIIDEQKGVTNTGTYYIVELDNSTHKLYLHSDSLFDPTSGNKVDFEAVASSNVNKDANLLAMNVTQFKLDTSKISGGYVVLGIKLEYGTREASITQNVYLRNSNASAEWTNNTGGTPSENPMEGYILKSIDSISCIKGSYGQGAAAEKSDFVINATYENENDPSDTKQAQVPNSDFESAQIGVQLNTIGQVKFEFTFANSALTAECNVNVVAGSVTVSLGDEGVASPEKSQINTHSEIKVYYSSSTSSETKNITKYVPEKKTCPTCGSDVIISDDGLYYKCTWTSGQSPNGQWWCPKPSATNPSVSELTVEEAHYDTSEHQVGTGKLVVANESTINDYSNVKVRLYFAQNNTGFTTVNSSDYITVDANNTTGNQSITYNITGTRDSGYTDYIEIEIPYMPKGDDIEGYTTYTFNYSWASADSSLASDDVVAMAVYSVDVGM